MEHDRFQGVVVPIVNPCHEDESLDWENLEQFSDRLINTPITGLYINGGTGDAANLTQKERLEIAGYLVPRLHQKNKLAIVHVGQTNQRQAIELAEQALKLEADAIASIPPKKDWPQIVDYYRSLCATGSKVIVYYIPGATGMTAQMPQLRMLLDIPGVIGIKMSDWNVFLLRSVKLEYPQHIVYSGFDEMLVPGLMYGADGSIGTWANLLPELYATVFRQVQSGHVDSILPLCAAYTEFLSIGWRYGIIDTFEELMYAKGYAQRCFRSPTSWRPSKIDRAVTADLLHRLDILNKAAAALIGEKA